MKKKTINDYADELLEAINEKRMVSADNLPEGFVSIDEISRRSVIHPRVVKERLCKLWTSGKAERLWVKERGKRPRFYYKLK